MLYPTNDLIQSLRAGNSHDAYEAIKAGADPNHISTDGDTSLDLAISRGDSVMVTALIKAGADVNQTHRGSTPLGRAVELGDFAIAQLLIEHGASPNACGRRGWTPLYHAAWRGNFEMMSLLVNAGADINAVDSQGDTALSWAFDKLETVTALLTLGANPREIETHLIKPLDFPQLAARPAFSELASRLESISGRSGLRYQFVPGSFTFILAPESVDMFLDQVYSQVLADDCLVYNSFHSDERGQFVYLLPTSDKFAAMAASRIGDRPDGHGTYGLIEGFKRFNAEFPYQLRGCQSKGMQIDFVDDSIDRGAAVRRLDEIFVELKREDSQHHCDPPISKWKNTPRGAIISWEWNV